MVKTAKNMLFHVFSNRVRNYADFYGQCVGYEAIFKNLIIEDDLYMNYNKRKFETNTD